MTRLLTTALIFFLPSLLLAQCLEGDCVNGYGVEKCDCGYTFEGIYADSAKVEGKLIKEEYIYEGPFANDMPNGVGKITYTDGSWYEGMFVDSRLEGEGVYHERGGYVYSGALINGHYQGWGVLENFDSILQIKSTQLGWFVDDNLNGPGVHFLSNGEFYIGLFKAGKYHGLGAYYFSADEEYEVGVYRRGDIHDGEEYQTIEAGQVLEFENGLKGWTITVEQQEDGALLVTWNDENGHGKFFVTDEQVRIHFTSPEGEHENQFDR